MSNYSFDLITKSGDNIDAAGNLVSIGNAPSINNFGSVDKVLLGYESR